MKKIKIVLIDNDAQFMNRLEYFLADELAGKADIQTITEASYFRKFFSFPKDIDVLLINENVFSKDLLKFNINELIILSEQSGADIDSNYHVINKYTSCEEIVKQLKLYCPMFGTQNKQTVVSLVCSANGGIGKTTISLGIAGALSKVGKKVIYINAQRINSFQYYFSDKSSLPNSTVASLISGTGNLSSILQSSIRNEYFDYFPSFNLALSSLGIDSSIYVEIIKELKEKNIYDSIIVDTDTAFDADLTDLITLADKVLIILNNKSYSAFSTNKLIDNISISDKEKYFFICNGTDVFNENDRLPVELDFTINDYVKHIKNIENLSIADISSHPDIKKISYLAI